MSREREKPEPNISQIVHNKGGLDVHISAKQGLRDTQQDRFRQYADVNTGAPEACESWIFNTFHAIHRITLHRASGSTCTMAIIGRDRRLTIAHIGDSPAVLFVRDRDTGEVTWKELAREHTPLIPAEAERILEAGRKLIHDGSRIDGGYPQALAVSRAFGDTTYRPAVISEPEIGHYSLNSLAPLGHTDAYLMVACDGIYERDGLNATQRQRLQEVDELYRQDPNRVPSMEEEREIAEIEKLKRRTPTRHEALTELAGIISRYGGDGEHNIAHKLTQHVLDEFGSEDNVTALVTKIPARMKHDAILMVADGHGGQACVEDVVECLDKQVVPLKVMNFNKNLSDYWDRMIGGKSRSAERS